MNRQSDPSRLGANSEASFPIVGIGASAGGIEALEGFYTNCPDNPGVAFVVVTHLNRARESKLTEILQGFTTLPVRVAEDGLAVAPNTVYVLPSDASIGIEGGMLQLKKLHSRESKPIDLFFSALAKDQGELAVGVILSGGDGDGTLGCKAIKERGGMTIAQVANGHGPRHPDMPDHAISSGLVDFAIPVAEMGKRIVEYARALHGIDNIAIHSEIVGSDASLSLQTEIYALLRQRVGHDFSGYKSKTFLRRVRRRMQVNQLSTPQAYVERLRQDPQEVSALFRDLLISVTSFFRDEDAFDSLAKIVIPKLFEHKAASDTVRVWVPGCATGEEAYSVAILLREHMRTLADPPRVQVFATDIDERALAVARAGRYPEALLDGVSAERRSRYFLSDGASWVISKEIRDLCVFSPHSVVRDPPFSRIDLVSCRNLLIYFGAGIQNQVGPLFNYALRPDGFLFLGAAENVSGFSDLFLPLDKHSRIFKRRADVTPSLRLPLMMTALRTSLGGDKQAGGQLLSVFGMRQLAETQVLDRHAPAHVVVNSEGDVVHYSGRTGKYLEAPLGMPTRQILNIARKGLRLDLRAMFRESVETSQSISREGIVIETDEGGLQRVGLTIEPILVASNAEPLYLILFFDEGTVLDPVETDRSSSLDGATARVEAELRETRERLQATVEEYETALEELKSSNEELVSVNEEQQSTNEELEASKEELQSVNEELHTLNGELNAKIDALDQANNDLQNLFDSTEVATVFLDKSLVIRSFTPAVGEIFNILPTDRGRPITDLSAKLRLPEFAADLSRVLSSRQTVERRAETRVGDRTYLVRFAPYKDSLNQVQGVVVTFVDGTTLIEAERRQQVLIGELQHRTRNLLAMVQSLALKTFPRGLELKTFSGRLAALSRVLGLVGKIEPERVSLREIVDLELDALGEAASGRVRVAGEAVSLSLSRIQTIALALHELATNAVKHGALNTEHGRIEIVWTVTLNEAGERILNLDWRESGLTSPPQSGKTGFGRDLIERALAYSTNAKTRLDFNPGGVSCHIEMPLESE